MFSETHEQLHINFKYFITLQHTDKHTSMSLKTNEGNNSIVIYLCKINLLDVNMFYSVLTCPIKVYITIHYKVIYARILTPARSIKIEI